MNGKILVVRSADGVAATLSGEGRVLGLEAGGRSWAVDGQTELVGCRAEPGVVTVQAGGTVSLRRRWAGPAGAAWVTERFAPAAGSVRWDVEVEGEGAAWGTEVVTRLSWARGDCARLRFWAPWGDPRSDLENPHPNDAGVANGTLPPWSVVKDWSDPLVARPFVDRVLMYGAPAFRYDAPRIGCCPFANDLWCIPLASVLDPAADAGVSVVLSPADELRDLTLRTSAAGELEFTRLRHRFQAGRVVRWTVDLVGHEADWRGGLRWMVGRYPAYFEPVNAKAHDMGGTGAYSCHDAEFDAAKMKRMAFRTNWRASFDFPYMGMFLPPVDRAESWTDFRGEQASIAKMESYAEKMHRHGFYVLSYFNLFEFGAHVAWPLPARKAQREADLWKDCHDFLGARLREAVLAVPEGTKQEQNPCAHMIPNGPYYTWEDGIVMDCGEPVYREFLLEQARRHLADLPGSDGLCIDRLDWARMYNERRDDGESWFEGKPVRSLVWSYQRLMDQLGPLMHAAGKVIFVNNHTKRLDLLRHVDGLFDEFTYAGSPLNTSGLLGLCMPVLGWTGAEENLKPDPDAFFQRFLHMGVFPMAPFPGNDHSLRPSAWVDQQYLDYGALLGAMRGRRWVLERHAIRVADDAAKANLFVVPGGYAAPVTFGGSARTARVVLRGIGTPARCWALHPGSADTATAVSAQADGDRLTLDVPLVRGCAMVRLEVG